MTVFGFLFVCARDFAFLFKEQWQLSICSLTLLPYHWACGCSHFIFSLYYLDCCVPSLALLAPLSSLSGVGCASFGRKINGEFPVLEAGKPLSRCKRGPAPNISNGLYPLWGHPAPLLFNALATHYRIGPKRVQVGAPGLSHSCSA